MTSIQASMNQPATEPGRDNILRLNDVKRRTGMSRSSIYAYIEAGNFPHRISLGQRSVGWYESEVNAWVASRQRVVNRNDK